MKDLDTLRILSKKGNIDLLLLLLKSPTLQTCELVNWLSQKYGIHPGTVYRRIKELTRLGLLKRQLINEKNVVYTILAKEKQPLLAIFKILKMNTLQKRNGKLIEVFKGTYVEYHQRYRI